jgi:hypothetical protein
MIPNDIRSKMRFLSESMDEVNENDNDDSRTVTNRFKMDLVDGVVFESRTASKFKLNLFRSRECCIVANLRRTLRSPSIMSFFYGLRVSQKIFPSSYGETPNTECCHCPVMILNGSKYFSSVNEKFLYRIFLHRHDIVKILFDPWEIIIEISLLQCRNGVKLDSKFLDGSILFKYLKAHNGMDLAKFISLYIELRLDCGNSPCDLILSNLDSTDLVFLNGSHDDYPWHSLSMASSSSYLCELEISSKLQPLLI